MTEKHKEVKAVAVKAPVINKEKSKLDAANFSDREEYEAAIKAK
jgi:hypothetical protein